MIHSAIFVSTIFYNLYFKITGCFKMVGMIEFEIGFVKSSGEINFQFLSGRIRIGFVGISRKVKEE